MASDSGIIRSGCAEVSPISMYWRSASTGVGDAVLGGHLADLVAHLFRKLQEVVTMPRSISSAVGAAFDW